MSEDNVGDGPSPHDAAPLSDRLNLSNFIAGLMNDLALLRAGKISVLDARARAELARQTLRGVHYVITAQKYLENLPPLPAPTKDPV